MKISKSHEKLRAIIEKAIETHHLTRKQYDQIIHLTTEDYFIDPLEQALLQQLQDMIKDKLIKITK